MKKIAIISRQLVVALFILLGMLGVASLVHAVAPTVVDDIQFGTASEDRALGVAVNASTGDWYAVGYTVGAFPTFTNQGGRDAYIRKYNSSSIEQWTVQVGTTGDDEWQKVEVDASGNIYVVGNTTGAFPTFTNQGSDDIIVAQYDSDGVQQWLDQFGSTVEDNGDAIALDGTDVYVAGWLDPGGAMPGQAALGDEDSWIRKYNNSGVAQWTRQFGTTAHDRLHGMAAHSGNIYVVGDTLGTFPGESASGSNDVFIRNYDTLGNVTWDSQYGTTAFDRGNDIDVDPSTGDLYVGSETAGAYPTFTNAGDRDAVLTKLNSSGTVQFHRQFGGTARDRPTRIDVEGQTIVLSGQAFGTLPGFESEGDRDAFLRFYDSLGNDFATEQFGTSGEDTLNGSALVNGLLYLGGKVGGTLPGESSAGGDDGFVRIYNAFMPMSTTPSRNAFDVTRTSTIQIIFNYSLNPATVTQANLPVFGSYNGLLPGSYVVSTTSVSNDTVTFTPTNPFEYNEEVSVTLSTNIQNTMSQSLSGDQSLRFVVETAAAPGTFQLSDEVSGLATTFLYSRAFDFDLDGDLDVVAFGFDRSLYLFENVAGRFQTSSVIVPSAGIFAGTVEQVIGDFDGDGYPDIVYVLTTSNDPVHIRIMRNNSGDGTFTEYESISVPQNLAFVDAVDFNRDGRLDLIGVESNDNSDMYLYRNDGGGTFTRVSLGISCTHDNRLIVNDFNADGIFDILVECRIPSKELELHLHNGDLTFRTPTTIPLDDPGNSITSFESLDMDGDGDLDVAMSSFFTPASTDFLIYENDGVGNFSLTQNLTPSDAVSRIHAADYDGDDDLDLFARIANSDRKVLVYRNDGTGTFNEQVNLDTPSLQAGDFGLGDFDGDGTLDFALTGHPFFGMQIFENRALLPPTEPTALFADDLDAQAGSTNPTLTVGTPVFSAICEDPDFAFVLQKYRIQVDDDDDFSSPVWDSGAAGTAMTDCAVGARSVNIAFGGVPLDIDGTTYYWRIKFWDEQDTEGAFSTSGDFFVLGASGSRRLRQAAEEQSPEPVEGTVREDSGGAAVQIFHGSASEDVRQVYDGGDEVDALEQIRALIALYAWLEPDLYQQTSLSSSFSTQSEDFFQLRSTHETLAEGLDFSDGYPYRDPDKLEIENIAEFLKVLVLKYNECFSPELMERMLSHDTAENRWWWAGYWHVLGDLIPLPYELWDAMDSYNTLALIELLLMNYCENKAL